MAFISIRDKLLGFIKRVQISGIVLFCVIGIVLSILVVQHFSKKLENSIIDGLYSKGRMLVLNNSLSMQGLVEDNSFLDIRNLVAKNVESDKDIIYGIFMDNQLQPWVMVTPDNSSGEITDAKTLDDSMSTWAHSLTGPEFKKTMLGNIPVIEFAAGVMSEEDLLGTIRYGISTESFNQAVMMNRRTMTFTHGFVTVAVMLTGLFFFWIFYRFGKRVSNEIIEPINDLTEVANSIAEGEYSTEVTTSTDDEIGVLAKNFDKMRQTIKEYTENLEKMVAERTEQLKAAQKELIKNAHQAGMADIATGTLHNVGNILNSVKTSAQVMSDLVSESQLDGFKKANIMLRENIDSIEEFIRVNPKGKKLMQYYLKLDEVFTLENNELHMHLRRLNDKVDAIVEVIAAQQTYAGTSSLTEEYALVDVIEDALTMQSGSIERYGITVEKNYNMTPHVPLQKVKLVHILINVINNAKEAMLNTSPEQRKLIFTIDKKDDTAVFLRIRDSGHGIAKGDLQKIFSHGFTTKANGHGFGLHSSANYMTEMNGEMWATSEGVGKGSTFILKFLLESSV